MKKLMIAAAMSALACGCASINKNDGGNSRLKPQVVKDRVHLKYEVGKKRVKGADQLNCLFGLICWGSSAHIADEGESCFGAKGKAKNGAYANACDAANCDQLVGARYTVATKDYFVFKKVHAEVSGYPAKVVGAEVVDALRTPPPSRGKPRPNAGNKK